MARGDEYCGLKRGESRIEKMTKKPKFKPKICRLMLNPEQAVLACSCYSAGYCSSRNSYWGAIVCFQRSGVPARCGHFSSSSVS